MGKAKDLGWAWKPDIHDHQPVVNIGSRKKKKKQVYRKNFYKTREWADVRYHAFKRYGRECVVCGTGKNLTVDHIKPYKQYPELGLDLDNLQVMCRLCNRGKGAKDHTDWR